jgi:hypothetical protein
MSQTIQKCQTLGQFFESLYMVSVTGVSTYSLFPLVDTLLYLLTLYGRSDITDT